MPVFKRKPGTGNHSFTLNGKRIRVRPLDEVECEAEDLQPFEEKYELVSERRRKKGTPLSAETARYEQLLRPRSWILNPDWEAPRGALVFTPPPSDRQGQLKVLAQLEGELALAERDLSEAKADWTAEVENDPMREKDESDPRGIHLDRIALRTAERNHVRAEVNEIQRRLDALEPAVAAEVDAFRRRRHLSGSLRKYAGLYTEVDGYAIEYDAEDKPVIPELGCSLREYLDRVREHKRSCRQSKAAA
jgi:hypothetical protein